MSTPNTPQSESHLTSTEENTANYHAAQGHTSEIIADIGGAREVRSILHTPITIDAYESEQQTIPQLLKAANLPENTPVVEYTNSYNSIDELVIALEQLEEETKADERPSTVSQFVYEKLADSEVLIDKINTSIAERKNQPETFYLATISLADLGLDTGAMIQDIYYAIKKRKGIKPCKAEDAIIDHINDRDLSRWKSFIITVEDKKSEVPSHSIMLIRKSEDDQCLLDMYPVIQSSRWHADDSIVVRLSKSDSDA